MIHWINLDKTIISNTTSVVKNKNWNICKKKKNE